MVPSTCPGLGSPEAGSGLSTTSGTPRHPAAREQGASENDSDRPGHASVEITLDTCSHVLPEMQGVVATAIDGGELLAGTP
jgi:hypothetical protein